MSKKPTFMSVIAAAEYVGLSTRHFRRRVAEMGLKEIQIKQNINKKAKIFYLTVDIDEKKRQGGFEMRLAPQKSKAL